MKSILSSFIILFNFVVVQAMAEVKCEPRTCQGPEVDVCFMGYESFWPESWRNLTYSRTCKPGALKYNTTTEQELETAIADLQNRCVTIRNLTIASHGLPGNITLFSSRHDIIRTSIEKQFGKLGCMTQANSTVLISGCEVGAGCTGRSFVGKMAEIVLPKGGEVSASTAVSGTLLPGIMPVLSSDGNKVVHSYSPPSTKNWANRNEFTGAKTPIDNSMCRGDELPPYATFVPVPAGSSGGAQ